MPKLNVSRAVSAAAKFTAAATLAASLFASAPYTNEARAITDSAPNAVNASLVFSPIGIDPSDSFGMCARNLSNATINALFVFEDQLNQTQQIESSAIKPGNNVCHTAVVKDIYYKMLPYIVLQSPVECSQATEYPGKCRIVASFERDTTSYDPVKGFSYVTRTHTEPVLMTGVPGNPRINPVLPR